MLKLQRFVLCCAVALAAFGAGVGLIELGNYVREAFISPQLNTGIGNARQISSPPTIVPPSAEFKTSTVVVPGGEDEENSREQWGDTGDYFLVGKKAKGFEEFDTLWFIDRVWSDQRRRIVAVEPQGGIYGDEEFKFSRVNVTGKRIAIVTRSVKGISYQFDGKFVNEKINHKSADGYEYEKEIRLKGRLTKWRNGKKIAEAKVSFELGGC